MNQEKPKQQVKTLSIRIPEDLYLAVSQYALDQELPSINAAVTSLLNNGLRVTGDKESAISEFILELIPEQRLKELASGTIKTS